MENLYIEFKMFDESEEETVYELVYNKKSCLIFVPHDGEFHNKLYECNREIPEELVPFVETIIRKELKRRELNRKNDSKNESWEVN